ncbi:hypothetical protein MIR68_007370 [Amoeboaphelidium protococcarum]|nr:hypothetical protein MIR68_007370 [Amoeboaphelidium protococcarum]
MVLTAQEKKNLLSILAGYTKDQVLQVGQRAGLNEMVGTKSKLIEKVVNAGLSVQHLQFFFVNGFSEDQTTRLLSQIGRTFCQKFGIAPINDQWVPLCGLAAAIMAKQHSMDWARLQTSDALNQASCSLSSTQDELLNTTHKAVRLDTVFFIIQWYNGVAFAVTLVHQLLTEVRPNPRLQQDGAQSPQNDGPLLGNVAQTPAFSEQSEAPQLNPFTMALTEAGQHDVAAMRSFSVQKCAIQDFAGRIISHLGKSFTLDKVENALQSNLGELPDPLSWWKQARQSAPCLVDEFALCKTVFVISKLLGGQCSVSLITTICVEALKYLSVQQTVYYIANILNGLGLVRTLDACCVCIRASAHLAVSIKLFKEYDKSSGGLWLAEAFGEDLIAGCFRGELPQMLLFWQYAANNQRITGMICALLAGVGSAMLFKGDLTAVKERAKHLSVSELLSASENGECKALLEHFKGEMKPVESELSMAFTHLMKLNGRASVGFRGIEDNNQELPSECALLGYPHTSEL